MRLRWTLKERGRDVDGAGSGLKCNLFLCSVRGISKGDVRTAPRNELVLDFRLPGQWKKLVLRLI